jgi:uncharacterized membrane protein YqaE (UPF0057 family)
MKNPSFALVSLFLAFALFFSPAYAAVAPGEIAGPGPRVATPDSAALKSAMADFKSLSRKEKKERFRGVKKELKAYKEAKKNGDDVSTSTLLLVLLSIILPPLAVYLYEGKQTTKRFWIDLILTLLIWLPGVIYALIVILGED